MLHTNNQIIKHKVGLLNLAEELQNVSRACKVMGVSRDTFHRYQELVQSGDMDALINKSRRVPNLKNRVDDATELAVIDFATQYPAYGQHRTSNELRKKGVFVSGSGVRSIWLRYDLENFKKRLKALAAKVAQDGIELNDHQIAAVSDSQPPGRPAELAHAHAGPGGRHLPGHGPAGLRHRLQGPARGSRRAGTGRGDRGTGRSPDRGPAGALRRPAPGLAAPDPASSQAPPGAAR